MAFGTSVSQTATTADTWSGLCIKLTVRFIDASGAASTLPEAGTLTFGTTTGTLYSGADCSTTAITTLALAAGASSAEVYYKTTTGGSDTVTAGFPSTDRISLVITVVIPTADTVLGQADFTSNSTACLTDSFNFCRAVDVMVADGRVWVADGFNARVLVWNTTAPGSASGANLVLGQPNMTSNAPATTSTGMMYPSDMAFAGNKLFIVDGDNNRVMVWNTFPVIDEAPASFVIGQPDLLTGTANTGGIGASRLSFPGSVETDGTRLVIPDYANNRVLIWNSIPSADSSSADVVLGQVDMSSAGSGLLRTTMLNPYFAGIEGGKLFVADSGNNRIMIWNSIPTENNIPPDVVLGQPDFDSGDFNRGGAVGANTLSRPGTLRVDSQGRLFIADYLNNRILIWNQVPSINGTAADAIIGQTNFTLSAPAVGADKIAGPWGLFFYGNYLWFSDYDNNRVLRMPVP